MDALSRQRKKDEEQLLKLAERKTNANKVSLEASRRKLIKSREAISDLKFDGL